MCPLRVREDQLWCTPDTIRKQLFDKWFAYNLVTESKNVKTILITFKEDNPLVVASQPPQRFSFGVWYNSFSSADIHGMNASMVKIANQQSSIEIRNSGHG